MCARDSYRSIASASEGLYRDRGSRFIAYAYPIASEGEVKALVESLKKEHHAARHHCFAYRLGPDGEIFRANDDGEPSGTAGRPILSAIDSAGLGDVLVVVVRYFGGILLGVPGLVKAYRSAAADALEKAGKIEKIPVKAYSLEFAYQQMNQVQRILKTFPGLEIVSQDFDMQCRVTVNVRLGVAEEFLETLNRTNNERGTCIQCRAVQTAAAGD